jgi:hypothetical protein
MSIVGVTQNGNTGWSGAKLLHFSLKHGTCGDKGVQTKSWTEYTREGDRGWYSEEQYRKAPEVYEETKSVTKTITILGYPARRQTLYNWINRKRMLPEDRCTFCGYNTPKHPRHPPIE